MSAVPASGAWARFPYWTVCGCLLLVEVVPCALGLGLPWPSCRELLMTSTSPSSSVLTVLLVLWHPATPSREICSISVLIIVLLWFSSLVHNRHPVNICLSSDTRACLLWPSAFRHSSPSFSLRPAKLAGHQRPSPYRYMVPIKAKRIYGSNC